MRRAEHCKARAILKVLQNKALSRLHPSDLSAFAETSARYFEVKGISLRTRVRKAASVRGVAL